MKTHLHIDSVVLKGVVDASRIAAALRQANLPENVVREITQAITRAVKP